MINTLSRCYPLFALQYPAGSQWLSAHSNVRWRGVLRIAYRGDLSRLSSGKIIECSFLHVHVKSFVFCWSRHPPLLDVRALCGMKVTRCLTESAPMFTQWHVCIYRQLEACSVVFIREEVVKPLPEGDDHPNRYVLVANKWQINAGHSSVSRLVYLQ